MNGDLVTVWQMLGDFDCHGTLRIGFFINQCCRCFSERLKLFELLSMSGIFVDEANDSLRVCQVILLCTFFNNDHCLLA